MPADNPVSTIRTDKGTSMEKHRSEINDHANAVNAELNRALNCAKDWANIGNGTTAGNLRTNAACDFVVNGELFNKASTDDLWDLSAETDTVAAQYRAYSLELDDTGTGSIVAGSNAASETLAYAGLAAPVAGQSRIGVFIAGPSTDFDDAGGLAAQGTIFNGWPLSV